MATINKRDPKIDREPGAQTVCKAAELSQRVSEAVEALGTAKVGDQRNEHKIDMSLKHS